MKFTTVIEPIKEYHIEEFLNLQTENDLSYWKKEDYIEESNREDSVSFAAVKGNNLAGFVISRLITIKESKFNNDKKTNSESEIEIYNLAVNKNFQREGIGTLLIQKVKAVGVKKNACSIWLEVRASNTTAISLYKKNQFKGIYQRKNFYRHPQEDALVMKLDICNHIKTL